MNGGRDIYEKIFSHTEDNIYSLFDTSIYMVFLLFTKKNNKITKYSKEEKNGDIHKEKASSMCKNRL